MFEPTHVCPRCGFCKRDLQELVPEDVWFQAKGRSHRKHVKPYSKKGLHRAGEPKQHGSRRDRAGQLDLRRILRGVLVTGTGFAVRCRYEFVQDAAVRGCIRG